jgi:hypothetical protein
MQIQRTIQTFKGHNCYAERDFKGKIGERFYRADRVSEINYGSQWRLRSRVKPMFRLISLGGFWLAFAPLLSDTPLPHSLPVKHFLPCALSRWRS